MYNKERIEHILEIVKKKRSVSVNELADRFGVSGATIRADLVKMDKAGLLTRTHGGAVTKLSVLREPLLTERAQDDKKRMIAAAALEFIHERDMILIDTGTTMTALAQAIADSPIEELTVYSNDLDVIRTLESKEHFTLSLFGGRVRNGFHYCCGGEILNELSNYHFNTLFLAASAFHETCGLTTENPDLARIKTAMIRAAANVILLADSSKAGSVHLRKFADLTDIDTLITDRALSRDYKQTLEQQIPTLITV